ncbi:MAG: bifunctional phosphopantothenoylcysteine decarboxylase/phosphopantothenate--cysteine ligase CoaBC [candidate division Zixibacteria bacterium]|nr:bifunctional phosphopantothenoylcysteine decarboxylase/phosphopantothenate--cysteine ligase CoaBC [candidate division Zixibacteria bacterium]
MSLKGYKITVGLTGGIAAYKTPFLIRLLKKDEAEVRAIMTRNAEKFITALTIETVSQNPVPIDMFPQDRFVGTHHIDMAGWPDLFVIAPTTANFIGKVASGICDDLLTTVICATNKPVMICPAMNSNMYLNPITQGNIDKLVKLGYHVISPGEGELACETVGPGRMAEPEDIFKAVTALLQKKKLLNKKKVIVTAGPCREYLDPVRYLSNESSGKMGYALAEAARDMGAEVTLVSGPTALRSPGGMKIIAVESTEQMYMAVRKAFPKADILIMAAAPADYTIAKPQSQKIKKQKSDLNVELSPTIDILQSLKKTKKTTQKVIGFALETENGLANATAKLKAKGLDMIVLNSLENIHPFGGDSNRVTLLPKKGKPIAFPTMTKRALADLICEHISRL